MFDSKFYAKKIWDLQMLAKKALKISNSRI